MSKLTQWLDHRMEVVGIENRKDLSEYSGVSEDALEDMNTVGSLTLLSRSERRWLAAALRVSLRKLEQLDSGEIESIRDDHVVDVDVRGRPRPRQEDDPAYWTPKEVRPDDRGTPLIGRIRSNGKAEPDEDWQEEWGRHIPQRFGKGHDIYGLELDEAGQSVVLRNIPVWEFREGMAAVYCWNGWEAEGWFGRVCLQESKTRVITADGERHDLDSANIVRIGKVVGRWPRLSSGMSESVPPTPPVKPRLLGKSQRLIQSGHTPS
jgi:hypothetical protein